MRWHRPLARLVVVVLLGGLVAAGARLAEDDPAEAVLATAGGAGAAVGPVEFEVVDASGWDKADLATTTTTAPEVTTTTAPAVEEVAAATTAATAAAATEPPAAEPEVTTPPPTVPPVTTARLTVNNQLPVPIDVLINGIALRMEPGQTGSMVVEADPYGDGWGNDAIDVVVADGSGCGYGDSSTWFEAGARYVVNFAPVGQLCADGVTPGPGFTVHQGLSSTG